jgi:anti-sigma factor RsiW
VIELSCSQCQDRAAELAAGVLEERERPETLAHLQSCARCQTSVAALAMTVTRLVDLLPEMDPPDGFAERVLAALPGPSTPPSPR